MFHRPHVGTLTSLAAQEKAGPGSPGCPAAPEGPRGRERRRRAARQEPLGSLETSSVWVVDVSADGEMRA